jgi:hypothetical protein
MRRNQMLCIFSGLVSMSCSGGLMSSHKQTSEKQKPPSSDHGTPESDQEVDASTSDQLKKLAKKNSNDLNSAKGSNHEALPKETPSSPDSESKTNTTTPTSEGDQKAMMRSAIQVGVAGASKTTLNDLQKSQVQAMLEGVCDQAQAGQAIDVAALTSGIMSLKLGPLGFDPSVLGSLGEGGAGIPEGILAGIPGGMNGGGLSKAIKDLVDAAMNADVDAILKAVEDIVGSV